MEIGKLQAIKVYRWFLFFNQSPSGILLGILWKLRMSLQLLRRKVPKALMTALTMSRNHNRKSWGRRFVKGFVYGLCKYTSDSFVEDGSMWLWVNDINMLFIHIIYQISFNILSDVVFQLWRVYMYAVFQSGAPCHTPTMFCMVGGVAGPREIHGVIEHKDEQCFWDGGDLERWGKPPSNGSFSAESFLNFMNLWVSFTYSNLKLQHCMQNHRM